LLWLAFVLRRWHQQLHFLCTYRTGTARVVEKNLGEVFERLCARPITPPFSGDAKPRSRLGSSSHDAPDSRLTLGASLVRAILTWLPRLKVQIPSLGRAQSFPSAP
jgi:hypothetical protein